MTPERRAHAVKQQALALGFHTVGVTDLSPPPHGDALRRWLERGMAGTMSYMHRQAARRLHPSTIVAGATRAVVVTKNHFTPDAAKAPVGAGHVAKYARGRDYHEQLRPALENLATFIRELGGEGTIARPYVDAGPVPERELAQRAGLGWIGKNTMLIDPARGSHLFLASVLTDLELAIDLPFEADRCGSCRLCLDACPTGAFPEPHVLDSPRCISYLTIEHRGAIDADLARQMDDWIFGCDVCQDVCPWNAKFAQPSEPAELDQRSALEWLPLDTFAAMDADEFDRRYGWTPLERPGLDGMRRNAGIASANRREEASCPTSPTE